MWPLRARSLALAFAIALLAGPALATPSSTVLAPNAAVLERGQVEASISRVVAPGPRGPALTETWIGAQVGATSGSARAGGLGAIEVGVDAIVPADPGAATVLVWNTKLALRAETRRAPAIATGIFQASTKANANARLGYLVADKAISVDGTAIGRLSLGGFVATGKSPGAFRGGPPFRDRPIGVLAGWRSPEVSGVSLGADLVSGSSRASGMNVGLEAGITADASIHAALSLATDRRSAVQQADAFVFGVTFRLGTSSRD